MQSLGSDRTNLTWRVTDALGRAIVGNVYAPGAVLPREDELSARNGVGRSAVREAVKVLEGKGLIEVRPRRGTSVLPFGRWNLYDHDVLSWMRAGAPSRGLLTELLEARRAFEPAAASWAALRGADEAINAVADAYCRMEASHRALDDPYEADLAFHSAVLEASGNRFFAGLSPLIGTALMFSFRVTNTARGDAVGDLAAHRCVLDAIAERRPDEAEAAMRALLTDVGDVLQSVGEASADD